MFWKTLWTRYRTEDGQLWFCLWRQRGRRVDEALHVRVLEES